MGMMKTLAIDRMNEAQVIMTLLQKTASERIVDALIIHGSWLAVHEIGLIGISDCAASARLRELARTGAVVSRYREGTRFKEWAIRQTEIPLDNKGNSETGL